MPWGELEDYSQLLREYERRTADYERRLKDYERAQATGGDQHALEQLKTELDLEQPQLEDLFKRLEVIRKDLARTRDAVA